MRDRAHQQRCSEDMLLTRLDASIEEVQFATTLTNAASDPLSVVSGVDGAIDKIEAEEIELVDGDEMLRAARQLAQESLVADFGAEFDRSPLELGTGNAAAANARPVAFADHAKDITAPVSASDLAEQVRALGQVVERHLLSIDNAATAFEVSFGGTSGPACFVKFSPSNTGYDVRVQVDPSQRQALSEQTETLRQRLGSRGISVGSISVTDRSSVDIAADMPRSCARPGR